MAKRLEDIGSGIVHFDSNIGNDYTLCGITTSADDDLGISALQPTDKPCNCKDCISHVMFCKMIRKSEIVSAKKTRKRNARCSRKPEKVEWKAVGLFAVRFINGEWSMEERCKTHSEAVEVARRLNEEDEDYGS